MSILSDLLHKRITFSQAASEATSWVEKMIASDPASQQAAAAALTGVKQAASNAVMLADTGLQAAITPAAETVAGAAEAAFAAATKGASLPFNPLITSGFDAIANALKAEIDVVALKAKAALATPPAHG